MHKRRALLPASLALLYATAVSTAAEPQFTLLLENNQPFPVNMPMVVRGLRLRDGPWRTEEGAPVQPVGTNSVLLARLAARGKQHITIQTGAGSEKDVFFLKPATNGVSLLYAGTQLGQLNWDVLVKPVSVVSREDSSATNHEDFDAAFSTLPLVFQKTSPGPLFDTWSAEASKAGLKLQIELLAYAAGFLDINARLTNESADEHAKVYAAVVCRWEQPSVNSRALCYDNRITALGEHAASPFRSGEGRHQFTQRGVDWVCATFSAGVSAAWLNDFAPSFTLLDNSAKNSFKQARYEGANLPQLGQEAQTVGERFYSITEIARSNIRSYRDRLADNALPARGQSVSFSSRLALNQGALSDVETDQMFVGFTSYNEQQKTADGVSISFGVKSVRFGTSYFPYSTLGENFDTLKLPGMDREAFWPLAADTVLRWRDFADDIRSDLRIAKAMGFEVIRLHHLELLAPIPKETQREYLDFLFGELRHLKLQTLLDSYASDSAMAELLTRYGDVIDAIELENEILIWGIPLDRPEQWKQTYAAIKQAAPHVRVHLTGYNNTGMFDRLQSLGVPFDRVGLHSYVDSLDALPTARGYALALGSYCSKLGKPPVITEWNWRQLTRMTPEARAKIYPAVFENALATRAIPEIYQFQFNETLAPNPRSGRGNVLRHYELINLSRRPKLEALELMKLMKKYSAEGSPTRSIDAPYTVVNLDRNGTATADVSIANRSGKKIRLTVAVESPADFKASLGSSATLELQPGESKPIRLACQAKERMPGFYYSFLRLEGAGQLLRYVWLEARLSGQPKLDTETKSTVRYPRGVAEELKLDFSRPCTVLYGAGAPVLEVETAFAIASTLESASGQAIEAIQANDLPRSSTSGRNLILVGNPKSNELITPSAAFIGDAKSGVVMQTRADAETRLLVTGVDSAAVERAGMDLLLRWWRYAKDSAARRVGLIEKDLPRGGDATRLP